MEEEMRINDDIKDDSNPFGFKASTSHDDDDNCLFANLTSRTLRGGDFFKDWDYPNQFKKTQRFNPLRNLVIRRRSQALKSAVCGKLSGVQQRYRRLFFNGKLDDNDRRFIEAGLNAKKRIDAQPNCDVKYAHIQFWNSNKDYHIKRMMKRLSGSSYYVCDSDGIGKLNMSSAQWNLWLNSELKR